MKLQYKPALLAVLCIALFGLCGCSKDDVSKLQTVRYDKHDFILYDGDSYAGGIIHHPDCPCRKHE